MDVTECLSASSVLFCGDVQKAALNLVKGNVCLFSLVLSGLDKALQTRDGKSNF